MVNAFAYWQGQQVSNATVTYLDDLQQAFGHIQELAGSVDAVEIWNGESGWPTDGEHESVPDSGGTTDAQPRWYRLRICQSRHRERSNFLFESCLCSS